MVRAELLPGYASLLSCPICYSTLFREDMMLKCIKQHSFDIAGEGYINFLRKKQPGDTKPMLQARREFLAHGPYRPLFDVLYKQATAFLPQISAPACLLDAGCGEGYYLGNLQQQLEQTDTSIRHHYIGIDISKEAIRMAAKRYKQALFLVANLKERLPIADSAVDILLNIFAPRNADEFARILAPGGLLLVVIPTPTHLLQLRTTLGLLDIEENKQQHVLDQFSPHFEVVTTTQITYTRHLKREQIQQVVMMTPNYWHLSEQRRSLLQELEEMDVAIGFQCLTLQKKQSPLTSKTQLHQL
jgi:ubiquinone/menaquinone biosynthesis C-methylase UbiE